LHSLLDTVRAPKAAAAVAAAAFRTRYQLTIHWSFFFEILQLLDEVTGLSENECLV
jgi:hypothetical protein